MVYLPSRVFLYLKLKTQYSLKGKQMKEIKKGVWVKSIVNPNWEQELLDLGCKVHPICKDTPKNKSKIWYLEDEDGCWNCVYPISGMPSYPTGAFTGFGGPLYVSIYNWKYGHVNKNFKLHPDMLKSDYIPKSTDTPSLVIRHKCDNKICLNPDHYESGTAQENWNDYWLRGVDRIPKDINYYMTLARPFLD